MSRSAAMKRTGYKAEAIYRRYAIIDPTMLREAVGKLGALHAVEGNYPSRPCFVEKLNGPSFNSALFCCTFVCTREWRNGRRAGLRIRPGSGASCPQGQRML